MALSLLGICFSSNNVSLKASCKVCVSGSSSPGVLQAQKGFPASKS